jgi:hypothetical protein
MTAVELRDQPVRLALRAAHAVLKNTHVKVSKSASPRARKARNCYASAGSNWVDTHDEERMYAEG